MNKEYGNSSIVKLSDRDAVRMRVSTYAGGSDKAGAFTTVREVVNNSIDEFKEAHGDTILVEYLKDGSIKVTDKARGCPVDWNESEGVYNYELIFLSLNAGGKYSAGDYEFSSGLNGIGNSLVILSSEFAYAEVKRDGYKYNLEFKKGELVGELQKEKIEGEYQTGTTIHWKPDMEVFEAVDFPEEWFTEYLEQQTIVNKGLTLKFINHNTNKDYTFFYENGIIDYLTKLNKEKNFTDIQYWKSETVGRDREDKPEYKSKYEIAFCFNNENPIIKSYHNSLFLKNGGSPHEAIKSAFTYSIDKLIKKLNKYEKKEKKITWEAIADSISIISNTYSTETSYENQTKFAITNKFIRDYLNEYLREQLEIYFIENPIEAEKIVEQVLINKRAAEKAESTRLNIKKKLQKSNNTFEKIDKLIECREEAENKELYIAEGDSAKDSLLQGRDKIFQSIYPIKGKILSCLKATPQQIFSNDVITNIYKILGCGVELKDKNNKSFSKFSLDDLQYDKIIIASDFDDDGHQITALLLTMFYVLTPTLLKEGYVYRAESPLFEIYDFKTDRLYYAYSEKERDQIVEKNGLVKYDVSRNKGLGELQAETVEETLMNPETRRLARYTVKDAEAAMNSLDLFMGTEVEPRRNYIEEHFDEYEFEL